jgi:hypothetical protein
LVAVVAVVIIQIQQLVDLVVEEKNLTVQVQQELQVKVMQEVAVVKVETMAVVVEVPAKLAALMEQHMAAMEWHLP